MVSPRSRVWLSLFSHNESKQIRNEMDPNLGHTAPLGTCGLQALYYKSKDKPEHRQTSDTTYGVLQELYKVQMYVWPVSTCAENLCCKMSMEMSNCCVLLYKAAAQVRAADQLRRQQGGTHTHKHTHTTHTHTHTHTRAHTHTHTHTHKTKQLRKLASGLQNMVISPYQWAPEWAWGRTQHVLPAAVLRLAAAPAAALS